MAKLVKGETITLRKPGKTKILHEVIDRPDLVIMESIDDITKNDDAAQTMTMKGKGVCATQTTKTTFKLLQDAGIPVAYDHEASEGLEPNEFAALKCKMIPLEVIGRRYGVGSYGKRFPNICGDEKNPVRFHSVKFEVNLKTSDGQINGEENQLLIMPIDILHASGTKQVEDPLIIDPYAPEWKLQHPKIPAWQSEAHRDFDFSIDPKTILPAGITMAQIEEITRKTFLVLEGAWAQLGSRLIDFKIEFGVDVNGKLLVADVIDNDSWRVRTADWQELSKQLFRDNHDLGEVLQRYELVEKLVKSWRIPKQAIVVWTGSPNDKFDVNFGLGIRGTNLRQIVISAHKSPNECLQKLEKILTEYPEGGVIISYVGLSNGLGPILAARTSWPVIAVPAVTPTVIQDVWSSLNIPSNVPLLTALNPKNAVLAAFNILAQKNPLAYALRQYELELLDPGM